MNRGQLYASRKNFIEDGLGSVLSVRRDFKSIRYARKSLTEEEYMQIADILGNVITINITGASLEDITDDAFRVALAGKEDISIPKGYEDRKEVLREIAPLFR